MSSGSYRQVDVRCPFYRSDDGRRRIICEGIIAGSSLSQTYKRKADFETQLRVFCCEHYRKCEICRILMEKYDEEA